MNYQSLRNASAARNVACDEIDYMIDTARVNADDTTVVEKSLSVDKWEQVFMDSLEMACAYASNEQQEAVKWFVAQGVRF